MNKELAELFLKIAARLRTAADDYERRAREFLDGVPLLRE